MTESEGTRLDLTLVLERFPGHAAQVRRLVLEDADFFSICEDYTLARATLARLGVSRQEQRNARDIADYIALVADLEREIADALRIPG